MNSLGILTTRSNAPASTPPGSRTASSTFLNEKQDLEDAVGPSRYTDDVARVRSEEEEGLLMADESLIHVLSWDQMEKRPRAGIGADPNTNANPSDGWRMIPKRISSAVIATLRVVIRTVTAPATYVLACFYDEKGGFSAFMPILRGWRKISRRKRKQSQALISSSEEEDEVDDGVPNPIVYAGSSHRRSRRSSSGSSSSTALQTDSEVDRNDSVSTRTRSKASGGAGEEASPKRSIRIQLYASAELMNMQKKRKVSAVSKPGPSTGPQSAMDAAAASLKSPNGAATSVSKLTRYPRAPVPPRPIIPKRQPSYTNLHQHPNRQHQKTLILDLDETLIHSVSKGSRYTTGHMVEVKMPNAIGPPGATIPPQVPILYYVHKRPHCDEFLRKVITSRNPTPPASLIFIQVAKWYNLIIFTASVQEYADPVIEWLELDRKYFSKRLYRQHCTHRNGCYIKDLTQVEPDLSKVMIIDNSPLSYAFHEGESSISLDGEYTDIIHSYNGADNALPIEGWISDPTDNGLLHLIPLLEGLQYATDVRAVLSLRMGLHQVSYGGKLE